MKWQNLSESMLRQNTNSDKKQEPSTELEAPVLNFFQNCLKKHSLTYKKIDDDYQNIIGHS